MHSRTMDLFKKYGQGVSAMNENEESTEKEVSEKKVALTSLVDLSHQFDICKPYFLQMDYLNKLHGQGTHSEHENFSPYRTVSAPCSDAITTGDFLGGDRSELPQYSTPCLQCLQGPHPSEIEYSKQALVEEHRKQSIPSNLMLADVPMLDPFSHFSVSEMGTETSGFSRSASDFKSSDPLACWRGIGFQDFENVNEVDNDVHYEKLAYSSVCTDRNVNRTSAFERLSFTPETRVSREKYVDVSANELIELLAERSKRWRVSSQKKERAQLFCGIGKDHQTKEVEAIMTPEVDGETCTWLQQADHGKRPFPNFKRRSVIHKDSKDGGTSEEGDLKVDSAHVRKRRKLIRPSLSKMNSPVGNVSKENKAQNQAEAVVGHCALHLLQQISEDGACEGLQGSFQNVTGPIGRIDQNVCGQEQQKPLLQKTGSNSRRLDAPQSSLSVTGPSCGQDENRLMETGCLTQNPIIYLDAQPEANYQHLVDSEGGNFGGRSQVIHLESTSRLGDNLYGSQMLQAWLRTQNTIVELDDQVVIEHRHCACEGEGDLDELPPIKQENVSEVAEDQSNIMQSENESRTGSLLQKAQMSLAEQAENENKHLIHGKQGDLEELSLDIRQEGTEEDTKKDEGDLDQPQNGNQILQDKSYSQNAKVKHGLLVHDGKGDLDELLEPIEHKITSEAVGNQRDIVQSKNGNQVSQTGSLFQKAEISLAEQTENKNYHIVNGERSDPEEPSQAIHQEGIADNIKKDEGDLEQPQNGNQILQDYSCSQNAKVKHGHLVHDGEDDLDELPEPIEREITSEAVENHSNIVQSKNENQILETGSLFQKSGMSLAEHADDQHRHLIHDGRGDSEKLSQAVQQENTVDVKMDERDLQQPQNGDQVLQDESCSRDAKTSSAEHADAILKGLVHDGKGVMSELSEDTRLESSIVHVQKDQDIQLSHNEDQILDTGSLSQEEMMTLAEAEIGPESSTPKCGVSLESYPKLFIRKVPRQI